LTRSAHRRWRRHDGTDYAGPVNNRKVSSVGCSGRRVNDTSTVIFAPVAIY
jgi:hypothetical protein